MNLTYHTVPVNDLPGVTYKLRISIIDFMPEYQKHPIGHNDMNGKPICYGDTVKHNGENWLIAYRYGKVMLKQPFMIAMLGITDYSELEVLKQVTAADDWLIIGYNTEDFIQSIIADEGTAQL